MLQLYNLDKIKIKGLKQYKDYCIESVLTSGDKTLSFLYPSKLASEIKEEGYIRTKTDEFVIKEISTNGEWNSIKATLNVEDLEGHPFEHFDTTEQTVEQCLNLALAGTGWTVQVNNVTKKRTIRKTNCSTWDIIQQAKKTYLVEMQFDTINKKINIAEKLGNDKGAYFMDSLNLRNLDIQSNSYDFYTRIIAIGKDDLKVTVENFQYSKKKKTLIWKDERYTDLASLTEDATEKLEEISKPYKAYGADIIDLASTSNQYSILAYKLGDTITLISKDKGIKEKQRIVKITEYPEEPHRNTCEIANSILSFADVQKEYQDTTDTVSNITSDDGTISEGAIKVAVKHLTADKLDVGSLNAVEIRVGKIEANKLDAEVAKIRFANIDEAIIKKASIDDLTATNIKVDILEGQTANINNLLAGNISAGSTQTIHLTSKNVVIDNAVIKDLIASKISVADLIAGNISTNKFRIVSDNGGIEIVGATQQFKDRNNKVRIQMGQDATGNFNFILRGEDGTTTLIDHTGIKEKAIANDLIKENMVATNAIGEKQINYNSLITGLNKDTNTQLIKASKVAIDLTGQSLEVSFNSLKSNVDGLEIGGRNLILNSGNFKQVEDWNKYSPVTIVDKDNFKVLTNNAIIATPNLNILEPNTEYVCTAEFMLSVDFNANYTTPNHIYVKKLSDNTHAAVTVEIVGGNRPLKANTWEKVIVKFKTMDTTEKLYFKFHLYTGNTSCTKWLKNVKLEKGNKTTDWTPAIEDTEQKIESNTTSINVVKGQIDTLVKDTNITYDGKAVKLQDFYSSFKQTSKEINLKVESLETMEIGNRNIVLDSNYNITTDKYVVKVMDLSVPLVKGNKYTIVLKGKIAQGQRFGIWANSGVGHLVWFPISKNSNETSVQVVQFTMIPDPAAGWDKKLTLYNYPNTGSAGGCTVEWVTIYEGHIKPPMDWTPAPEDVDSNINNLSNRMTTAESKITANAIVSTVTSSTSYINNLKGKANQSDLIATDKNVTGLTNRVAKAEQKITDNAIISTVSSAMESGEKKFATTSAMKQTASEIRFDFSQSGGYNILKNSKGKNGALGWSSNGGGIAVESDIDFGTCFKTATPNGVSGEWYKLKNDTNYVYEGYIYSRGVISGSSVTPLHFWCNSTYSGGQNQCTIMDYRQSVTTMNKWTKCYVHFKTAATGNVLFRPFIYTGGSSFELWFTELSLSESSVETKWTPHPDELYSGNTTIDGNGVEITNGALKVTNANSQVVIDGKYNVHKIVATGIITIEMPVGVTERTYYVEHNLGFMPAHTCYEMLDATRCITLPSMSLANVVGLSGDVLGFSNILRSRADTNKLLFDFIRCESEKNKYASVKIRYFIYKEVAF